MKKKLIILIPFFALALLITSCSKDSPSSPVNNTPEGKWTGTGQYGTTPGGATYYFALTFKSTGVVDIVGDNTTGIDNATGTWQIVQDSVRVTYRYAASSAIYTLAGKFSSSSNIMAGTIGLGITTGVGLFSVTKQ